MLKIKELSKVYRTSKKSYFAALNKVSFEIENENMVAIIGESGSGKSTLMNLISTIDSPTGGYVDYSGTKISFLKEKEKANYRKENIGFIFQSFNLLNDISILDNVSIVMEIAGCEKDVREKRAAKLLELVGLKDHLNKKPGFLSGGQKQRVAIARALANDPEVILADEPTGALDSTTSKEIMKLLATIASSGKKVLIVTHDMKVASYCERIIRMEDGEIIEDKLNEAEVLGRLEIPKAVPMPKKGLGISGIFKLSSSSFLRRLKKNVVLALGTSIAVASLLIINLATSSINGYIDGIYKMYGNNNVVVAQVVSASQTGEDINVDKVEKILDFESLEGYEKHADVPIYNIEYMSLNLSPEERLSPRVLYPEEFENFGTKDLVSGKAPSNINEVVVSEDTAKTLGYNKDDILGQEIEVYITTDMQDMFASSNGQQEEEQEAQTITEKFTVSGVLINTDLTPNQSVICITDEYAKKFGILEQNMMKKYLIQIEDGSQNKAAETINALNSKLTAENVFVFAMRDMMVVSIIEIGLDFAFTTFTFILAVSVFVAAIMIAVMSYVSILERMREVGVLRAIGARKRDIRRMFYTESFAIGLFAGVFANIIGIIAGIVMVKVANDKMPFENIAGPLTLEFSPIVPIAIIVLSIVLALVSSFISINMGLKVSPVEALKRK